MLDNWFRDLTAPIREIKAKIYGAKNLKDGLVGDINRIKRSVGIQDKKPDEPPKK